MCELLTKKLKHWENDLLDLGKKNKMINYKESLRSTVKLTYPSFDDLFCRILNNEELTFKRLLDKNFDTRTFSFLSLLEALSFPMTVSVGEIDTPLSFSECQKTLKNLRSKAKLALEEQGTNILYMVVGFIEWYEEELPDIIYKSPLIMIPVTLSVNSSQSPYILKRYANEDIDVNPTLSYLFDIKFGIALPHFELDSSSLNNFISEMELIASSKNWKIIREISLALISFSKINMYKDIQNNWNRLLDHNVLRDISGCNDSKAYIEHELLNHDKISAIFNFQVLDADPSQQDAVLLSQRGISFVMQGPPGTGKSQTITNIIAQGLADGKKILFVSEKMAALSVVYRRLEEVMLSDFCLPLHNYKASKKEIIEEIAETLNIPLQHVKEDAIANLYYLDNERDLLNQYAFDLHQLIEPLGLSIYQAYGFLNKLSAVTDIDFELDNIGTITKEQFYDMQYNIYNYEIALNCIGDSIENNSWINTNIDSFSSDLQERINILFSYICDSLSSIYSISQKLSKHYDFNLLSSFCEFDNAIEILKWACKMNGIPLSWLYDKDLDALYNKALDNKNKFSDYMEIKNNITYFYSDDIFNINPVLLRNTIDNNLQSLYELVPNHPIQIIELKNKVCDLLLSTKTILADIDCIRKYTGINSPVTFNDAHVYYNIVHYTKLNPFVTNDWFEPKNLDSIKDLTELAKSKWDTLNVLKDEITLNFNENFLDMPSDKLCNKFEMYSDIISKIISYSKCKLESFTFKVAKDFVDNVCSVINELLQCFKSVKLNNENFVKKYGFKEFSDFNDIDEQLNISNLTLNPIFPHLNWIHEEKSVKIKESIKNCQNYYISIKSLTNKILKICTANAFNLDAEKILNRFNTEYNNISKHLKNSYRQDRKLIHDIYKADDSKLLDEQIIAILEDLSSIKKQKKWLSDNDEFLSKNLGIHYKGEFTNWGKVGMNIELFNSNYSLFDSPAKALRALSIESEKEFSQIKDYIFSLNKLKNISDSIRILCVIDENIDNIPFGQFKSKLNEIYFTACDISTIFDTAIHYCKDKDLPYPVIHEYINKVEDYKNRIVNIKNIEDNCKLYFPKRYLRDKTNWNDIYSDIDCFTNILSCYENHNIPDNMKKLLIENRVAFDDVKYASSEHIFNLYQEINSIIKISNDSKISDSLEVLQKILSITETIDNSYNEVLAKSKVPRNQTEAYQDINKLISIYNTSQLYSDDNLKDCYHNYFDGLNTDWEHILQKLSDATAFKELIVKNNLPLSFVEKCCSVDLSEDFSKVLDFEGSIFEIENSLKEAESFFNLSPNLRFMAFFDVINMLSACKNNFLLLEKWIDYCKARKKCCEIGLLNFILTIEEKKENAVLFSFNKSFYKKWLEHVTSDSILTFNAQAHNNRVKRFCQLDSFQLKLARMRIREKLISNISSNENKLIKNELVILKNEVNKKRSNMSIRKLFSAIPNLLLELKPCLMMSPLTVSYFLDADIYNFDMVIFDEASQIFPQDAIGAILRGKQVIISGDSNQLPPNAFFLSSTGNIYEEHDEDNGVFYTADPLFSVLDEASQNLPSILLNWHYRSRHEQLIAFSNKEIYKNSLITFPSNMEIVQDLGVEYVYVENGIYENRCNIFEAQECIRLLIEHIHKNPNRSLGIIAFSEKQQTTIEKFVDTFREINSNYEWFFDQEKDEPFFIKNLENAQGDERDTIFFSICYARDRNNKMNMRLGPLSHMGGERRLNVAITRAKYNVKIVGSILPSDLDLNNITSEGVKMLRFYIEFAIKGKNNNTLPSQKQSLDLFSDTVAKFLESKGYSVSRNVGYSKYTVDIAVSDVNRPGVFYAGIECDGNTYVMARTARSRDRLRHDVLTGMGWRLYRVWSSDWIRNTEDASNNLLAFIEDAFTKPLMNSLDLAVALQSPESNDLENVMKRLFKKPSTKSEALTLSDYRKISWEDCNFSQQSDKNVKVKEAVLHLMTVEQPIHRKLIYRRLADFLGNEKVTASIRKTVDPIIDNLLNEKHLIKDNDFFYFADLNEFPTRVAGERVIDNIYIGEISGIIKKIIKNNKVLSYVDLLTYTVRLLGFERKGSKISKAIDDSLLYLLEQGIIERTNEKIELKES